MSSFIESLQLRAEDVIALATPDLPSENFERRSGRFIRGPIPSDWVEQAAKLPGKALHAEMALRYLDGFEQTGTLKLRPSVRNAFGMDRFSCSRALEQLEAENLTRMSRVCSHRHRVQCTATWQPQS